MAGGGSSTQLDATQTTHLVHSLTSNAAILFTFSTVFSRREAKRPEDKQQTGKSVRPRSTTSTPYGMICTVCCRVRHSDRQERRGHVPKPPSNGGPRLGSGSILGDPNPAAHMPWLFLGVTYVGGCSGKGVGFGKEDGGSNAMQCGERKKGGQGGTAATDRGSTRSIRTCQCPPAGAHGELARWLILSPQPTLTVAQTDDSSTAGGGQAAMGGERSCRLVGRRSFVRSTE